MIFKIKRKLVYYNKYNMPPSFWKKEILELSSNEITFEKRIKELFTSFSFSEEEKIRISDFLYKTSIDNKTKLLSVNHLPNEKQLESIIFDKGPLFVIAWPGTGKTSILTKRLAYLVYNWISPAKILCLTFTNTGVDEITTRAKKFINMVDSSWKFKNEDVDINTFHKFCKDYLKETNSSWKLTTEKIEKDLAESIYKDIEWTYIFDSNNSKYYEEMLSLIKKLKSKHIGPAELAILIESSFVKSLNLEETTIKEEDKLTAREFVQFYKEYNKLLKEKNYYWLDEVVDLLIEEFKKEDSPLLKNIQEKYEYIMIDEYQDTSPNQNDVIKYMCWLINSRKTQAGFQEIIEPNIFVVWDDDQSIFKFQGADVKNMEDLRNDLLKFPNFKSITLDNNYRSSQNILDVSNFAIQFNDNRLDSKKYLQSKIPNDAKNLVNIFWFQTDEDETTFVYNEIIKFIDLNKDDKKKQIWILSPTNWNLEILENLLEDNNISYIRNGNCDIKWYKNTKEIFDFFELIMKIKFIESKSNYSEGIDNFKFPISLKDYKISQLNINLFQLLMNKKFKKEYQISLKDLIKISTENLYKSVYTKEKQNSKELSMEEIIDLEFDKENKEKEETGTGKSEREKRKEYETIINFYTERYWEMKEHLQDANFIEKLYYIYWVNKNKDYFSQNQEKYKNQIKYIQNLRLSQETLSSISNLIWWIQGIGKEFINDTTWISNFAKNFRDIFDIFEDKSNYELFLFYKNKFLNNHNDDKTGKEERKTLKTFIDYINKETILKPDDEDSKKDARNKYPTNEMSQVVLTTVHKSKGKEYETVILYKTQKINWENSRNSGKSVIKKEFFNLDEQVYFDDYDINERRRLFYVGLTRAKNNLIITYSNYYGTTEWKPNSVSSFIKDKEEGKWLADYLTLINSWMDLHWKIEHKEYHESLPLENIKENIDRYKELFDDDIEFKEWITNKLNKYQFSYTTYKKLLENPLTFLEEEILNIPQEETRSPELFWTIIHDVITSYFEFHKEKREGEFDWEKDLNIRLQQKMYGNIMNYLSKGKKIMKTFFSEIEKEKIDFKNIEVEHYFATKAEEKWIQLKLMWYIDKLEKVKEDDEVYSITDYKISEKTFEDKEKEYKNQLHFYLTAKRIEGKGIQDLFIELLSNKGGYSKHKIEIDEGIVKDIMWKLEIIKTKCFDKFHFPEKFNSLYI